MVYEDHHFNTRPPYDRRSLARALEQGLTPSGHRIAFLMPRYALSAQDLRALEAHLRGLSVKPYPGASADRAHFATVLTPGAAKARHREVVEVLSACFRERYPPDRAAGMRWQLHVWELQGPAQDWTRQRNAHMARQPVFALVSGMGGADWAPVHQFLAPDSDAGRIGADALRRHLPGRQIEDRVIDRFDSDGLREALGAVTPDTTVVFWSAHPERGASHEHRGQQGRRTHAIKTFEPEGSGVRSPACGRRLNRLLKYLTAPPTSRRRLG